MQTELIKITNPSAQSESIARAGGVLRRGGLVAFPTETVYGLGANGLDAAACARIYEAKGRPSDNPLILHVADRAMIDTIAADVPPCAEKLLAAFCPGPITLILRRKPIVPDRITGGLATVGIRMPENAIARAMIRAAGVPIAAPSANISGRPSPTTAASVLRLEQRVVAKAAVALRGAEHLAAPDAVGDDGLRVVGVPHPHRCRNVLLWGG